MNSHRTLTCVDRRLLGENVLTTFHKSAQFKSLFNNPTCPKGRLEEVRGVRLQDIHEESFRNPSGGLVPGVCKTPRRFW